MRTLKSSTFKPSPDRHGREVVANKILLSLPRKQRQEAFSRLEFVELPVRTVLHEGAQPIHFGYFINSGLASVLSVMKDGKSLEVGLAGSEGFVGLPLVVGLKTAPTRVIMQVAGSAFRISAKKLNSALKGCNQLQKELLQYTQEMTMQATQVAACNRVHGVNQRLARWLLMSQDRLGGDLVPLTQDFLAHMLGTRRASVTVAAGILHKAGLITYSRGAIKIPSRRNLENAACECYAALIQQTRLWHKESKRFPSRREETLAA
jgi:CRP-like cAMP-binding protein